MSITTCRTSSLTKLCLRTAGGAKRLAALADAAGPVRDAYLAGGAVAELEATFAGLLGKEACAFFPTGTLANNVAVRLLAGEHPLALCQADSHLYRDESDMAERLAGVNLVPIGSGTTRLDVAMLAAACDAAEKAPYPRRVGAIALESPVRRLDGALIPSERMTAIGAWAQGRGTPMHLDAARLLLPYAERTVRASEEAAAAVDPVRNLTGGTVAFGTFSSAHHFLHADLVTNFRALHPRVTVRLVRLKVFCPES